MLSQNVLRHGTEIPATESLKLCAGPLTLLLDPDTALVRQIRLGDHEVLRGIYGAIRDQHWNTIQPKVSNLTLEDSKTSFRVSCDLVCRDDSEGIDFAWRAEIEGDNEGRITYRFDGEAQSDFKRNRIGLCVLHPITECAGKPCRVESVDGSLEQGTFPARISPHQPFKNIRAIRHEPAPGQTTEVRMEGETFEMEDQRNWTDASFKTYSTPVDLPLPVRVEKGTRIEQCVTLTLTEPRRKILPILMGRSPQLSISTTTVTPKPSLGLCLPPDAQPLTDSEVERLRLLQLSHLRVDLDLAGNYGPVLEQAVAEASRVETGLHVAIHLSADADTELKRLAAELKRITPSVQLWLVFHKEEAVTDERWVTLVRETVGATGSAAMIAAGTTLWFTELNRNRPASGSAAFPCYSITPQCHAFDNNTMVQNLAGQVSTVETAREISSRPVVISPISLQSQPNPPRKSDPEPDPASLPPGVDPRQLSLFGAGWTLGSLAGLMSCGNVHALTYFETTGWRGIMETSSGSRSPGLFPSIPGAVFPVYHVFAELVGYNRIHQTHSSHPLDVEAVTLLDPKNKRRILVANLLNESQQVRIKTGTCQARVKYLDETNAIEAMTAPEKFRAETGKLQESVSGKIELELHPYALATVDIL